MYRTVLAICLLVEASGLAQVQPDRPRYVDSRHVVLSFRSAGGTTIEQVHVWVSADTGESWEEVTVARAGDETVRIDSPGDGRYAFYVVLENRAGRSAPPPTRGTPPHVRVIVDTAPPTMQIHKARQTAATDGPPRLRLNVSLIEENLDDSGTRIFYRTPDDAAWRDGGVVLFTDGIIEWTPPPDTGPRVDLRLVATDLAGNRAIDEIRDVEITLPVASASKEDQRPGTPAPTETVGPAESRSLAVPPVTPVTIDPLPRVTLDDDGFPAAAQAPAESQQKSRRLQAQAARFLAQGDLSLAGARLHDALSLTPNDPDLLTKLGSVYYRARQFDEATAQFRAALAASPDHPGAIEGLALVAVNQNRYAQARSHLEHLLRLEPESARHWLHYGDVEHLAGNDAEALAAWDKALGLEAAAETVREQARRRIKLFRQREYSAK